MNTSLTGSAQRATRFFLSALCALAVLFVMAGAAHATSVNLRIESPTETIFNGTVNTGPRSVNTLSGNCTGTTSSVAIAKPTTVTAVADAIAAMGPSAPAFATAYMGTYLCTIGNYSEAYPNGSWFLKINNQDSPAVPGYVTADDQLNNGDSVLVYYSGGNPTKSLDLKLPAEAKPGAVISGSVNTYSILSGDVLTHEAGITVSGDGASATTSADGSFSISFAQPGRYLITATEAGAVRGSTWITIDPAAIAPPLIVHINRFVKCNNTYKKSSKMHKRCVRIVRAKQAAAKKPGSK